MDWKISKMITAGRLLEVWSLRLRMHQEGPKQWTPVLQKAVTGLIENLTILDSSEEIKLDVDVNRNPIAIFIRVATGVVIGAIPQAENVSDDFGDAVQRGLQ